MKSSPREPAVEVATGGEPIWASGVSPKFTRVNLEDSIRATDLDWTIIRPSGLSEDEGTGNYRAEVGYSVPESSTTTRGDLAEYILEEPDSEQFLQEGVAVVTV